MRPKKLIIDGINSFTERREIDFSLLSGSLFCVCGNTGSGKTTILDSMILALYGDCGRGGGLGGGAVLSDYISLTRDNAEVEFEFSMNGKNYTVNRRFRRGKDGKAYLYEGDTLVSSQKTEINRIIEEVIGLNRADFTQVVVLEQGQFDKFLKRAGRERSATVSNLFKLDMYKDLNKRVSMRLNAINAKMEASQKLISAYEHMNISKLEEINAALKQTNEDNRLYQAALKIAQENLNHQLEQKKKNERFIAAQEQLKQLKAELEQIKGELAAQLLAQKGALNSEQQKIKLEFAQIEAKKTQISKNIEQNDQEIERLRTRTSKAKAYILDRFEHGLDNSDLEIKAERALDDHKRLTLQLNDLNKKLAQQQLNEDKTSAQITQKRADIAQNQVKMTQAQALLKQAQRNEAIGFITMNLNKGDNCPICLRKIETLPKNSEQQNVAQLQINADTLTSKFNLLNLEAAALNEKLRGIIEAKSHLSMDICATNQALTATKLIKNLSSDQIDFMYKAAQSIPQFKAQIDEKISEQAALKSTLELLESNKQGLNVRFEAVKADISDNLSLLDIYADPELSAAHSQSNGEFSPQKIESLLKSFSKIETQIELIKNEHLNGDFNPEKFNETQIKYEQIRQAQANALIKIGELTFELQTISEGLEKRKQIEQEYDQLKSQAIRLETLFSLFKGEKFLEFVCEEYVASFTATASQILNKITLGRYSLHYDRQDSKFYVADYFFFNQKRKVSTLSGGETFLASLSLSAAISAHISRKSHEFFFLDEGFGTLDPESIGAVALALEELSRTCLVGLISHCTELTERISSKISVTKADSQNGSNIEII